MSEAAKAVLSLVYRAALQVECPLCHEKAGTGCATRRGERIKAPHSRRIEAAREAGHWGIA